MAVAVQVVQDTIRFWRRLFVRVFHSQLRRCFSEMARRLRSSACSAPSASFAVGPRWAKRRRPRVQRRRTPSSHAMPHELQSIVSLPRCHDGAPIDGPVDCGDPSRHELDGRKVGHGAPAARRWHGIRRAGAPETAFSARSCLRLPSAPVSLGHPASRFGRAARPYRACFRHRRENVSILVLGASGSCARFSRMGQCSRRHRTKPPAYPDATILPEGPCDAECMQACPKCNPLHHLSTEIAPLWNAWPTHLERLLRRLG